MDGVGSEGQAEGERRGKLVGGREGWQREDTVNKVHSHFSSLLIN